MNFVAYALGFGQGLRVTGVSHFVDTGWQYLPHQFELLRVLPIIFGKGSVDQGRRRARIDPTGQTDNTAGFANRQNRIDMFNPENAI